MPLTATASEKSFFQYDQLLSLPIDYIVEIAQKTMNLIYFLINNRLEYISPRKDGYRIISLPFPRNNCVVYDLYLSALDNKLITLEDFELLLK